ncbi:alpha-N-arabinofuranosidase [Demequina capsici]|uniref:non-reducing end alpha-L-arabinofuranosidase n=1 Tax=Demequina capsici TaxID=3075620 RepID=A0AA96F906_9MICO|nr:alpha-L-arabinofuranosidase C-terminal domain-containing protein [Demequina sp. OYTSA14]WNM24251.1 alpha-L-arabinofuranosidase C-terminal domain-containing protein [Demequina sp. OYTSA14]
MDHARVAISTDVERARISRHLYGHFAEHLGRCIYGGFWVGEDSDLPHIDGIRADVVEALRRLEVPNLRWPGGCFADEYHWRDGIGPREDRPAMVNSHWGDVVEDNSFGTHEFMRLCELLGAAPYVNGNLGSGTVREMSEWLEYLTRADDSPMARLRRDNGRDEPWLVPFWGLGNEAWGCGGSMRPQAYADEARRYATFCKDHGGNTVSRIAAGGADDDLSWTRALMEAVACVNCQTSPDSPIFQGVSFHYYTYASQGINTESATEFSTTDYLRTMLRATGIERAIRAHVAVMDSYDPDGKVALVCDEWGTWWQPEPGTNPGFLHQQNTMRDALVAGVHFDAFHAHARRLRMANIAQTVNVLQAMLLTGDDGALVLTPTYHVFEMSKGHQDATSVESAVTAAPVIDVEGTPLGALSASASVKDGALLVSLSHLDPDDSLDVVLDVRGATITGTTARVLASGSLTAHNTAAEPHVVAPRELDVNVDGALVRVTMPPHSFATVHVTLDRD